LLLHACSSKYFEKITVNYSFLKRTFEKHIAINLINDKQMERDIVGRDLLIFPSLDSTNDFCRKLLNSQDLQEGTVVWAHHQSKGRGLAGSAWESEEGQNLTFSVILHPFFLKPSDQFYLSMVTSLGITGFLDEFKDNIRIKWPNDIYYDKSKIAGILIENSIMENIITDSIVGIGININQTAFGSHIPNPVSLKLVTGKHHPLKARLESLCEKINHWYFLLKQGKKAEIRNRYTEQLYRLNEKIPFRHNDKVFTGTVRGVDGFGRMALELEDGNTSYFNLKEVEFI
jgi:BirA family transcriptional regulator, biotin operon repressor / biotin---[acetyl-CoA-carboxylase] ligase